MPGLADQVDEQAIGAGDAGGKLAEEREAGIDVDAFAVARVDQSRRSASGSLAVLQAEDRLIRRGKSAPEIEAALLIPAFEIRLGNFVRRVQQRDYRARESARANADR